MVPRGDARAREGDDRIDTTTLAAWFRAQSSACGDLGSALYERLLADLADTFERRGVPSEIDALLQRPWRFGDALPLRLMGVTHRFAQSGLAPDLAEVFPSCGGHGDYPDDLADRVRRRWSEHPAEVLAAVEVAPQTNEVARSAGLIVGLALLQRAWRVPLRLIEIGTSGGLNLRLDRFRYDIDGRTVAGNPVGAVRLADRWSGAQFPADVELTIAARVGVDPQPRDATIPDNASWLRSFVWPDQAERLERFDAAVETARANPALIEQVSDTAEWLHDTLGEQTSNGSGVGTVVFHSIVWQYLAPADRRRVASTIEQAGQRATVDAPLAWLSYEPDEATRDRAVIRVRTWPDDAERLVGWADFHGRWVRLAPPSTV